MAFGLNSFLCGSGSGHFLNRLENTARDLVGIALAVRTTIFQVTFVTVVDKAVGDPDGRTAVGDTVAEFVDRLGLVKTGQTKVVVRTINRHVLVHVLLESSHELLEVILAPDFAHIIRGCKSALAELACSWAGRCRQYVAYKLLFTPSQNLS